MFSITIVPLSPHRVQPRSLPRGLPLTVFFWGILVRGKNVLCGLMHGWMILRWTLTERRLERGLQNSSVEMKYLDIFHRKDWGSVCLDDYVWIGGDLLWRRRWIGEKRRWSDGSSTFIEVRKFFVDNDQQKVFKNFYDQRQKARNDFSAKLHAILVHFLLHPNLLISLRSILLHIDLILRICNPRITLGGCSYRSKFPLTAFKPVRFPISYEWLNKYVCRPWFHAMHLQNRHHFSWQQALDCTWSSNWKFRREISIIFRFQHGNCLRYNDI